jgi:hypothetical protein
VNDKTVGYFIFILSLLGIIGYACWLLAPAPAWLEWLFYYNITGERIRWAIIAPLLLAVVGFLAIAMWIGWTMATTPPPIPIEQLEAEKEEKKEKA